MSHCSHQSKEGSSNFIPKDEPPQISSQDRLSQSGLTTHRSLSALLPAQGFILLPLHCHIPWQRIVEAKLQSMHLRRILLTTGEFRKPLIAWKMPPPMAPMVKAPPQSSTILHGLERKIEMKILNPITLNCVSGMDPALWHWYNQSEDQTWCLYCLISSSLSKQQQKTRISQQNKLNLCQSLLAHFPGVGSTK